MTVEIAPGPASIGTPSGMMPMSSFWIPSAVSIGVSRCWLRRAWTMSRAFRPMSTPPAILNAPIVIPKILKIRLPPSANAMSVIAQVHAPRRASTRRCAGASRAVIARNVGMTANGSTMNRIDVKIRTSSIARSVNARALPSGRREYAASSPWASAHPAAARARDCTFRRRSES